VTPGLLVESEKDRVNSADGDRPAAAIDTYNFEDNLTLFPHEFTKGAQSLLLGY
jgi:hypothetical protein